MTEHDTTSMQELLDKQTHLPRHIAVRCAVDISHLDGGYPLAMDHLE